MVKCEEHLFFLQMLLASGNVLRVDVDVYYYVQNPTMGMEPVSVGSLERRRRNEKQDLFMTKSRLREKGLAGLPKIRPSNFHKHHS